MTDSRDSDLLEIPAFLRRQAGCVQYREPRGNVVRLTIPARKNRNQPTQAQAKRLLKLGWSESQIRRIDRAYAAEAVAHDWPPSARFAPAVIPIPTPTGKDSK